MKYTIFGKTFVDLAQKDFLTSGGEGKIYVKGGIAYKVYNDLKNMIPLGKIQELSVLTHSNIIKPEDVLIDQNNKPVGYTMKFVDDTYVLCQLFTKVFRDRNKITPEMILSLVRKLQEMVKHIHDNNILIVDLNELNFLVSKSFDNIYAIDTCGYQTKNFPATALMESIRDRHTKGFSTLTDWFAFAIVSFQLFIGIHPYKGKHPQLKNIEDRMMKNVSVLNKEVSLPAACYPFTVIPPIYLDWYKAVLERGERLAPPESLQDVISLVQTVKKTIGSNNFDIQEIGVFDGQILNVLFFGGKEIVLTGQTIYMGKDKTHALTNCNIVTSPKFNIVVAAAVEKRKLKLFNATARENINLPIEVDSVMQSDNRLYVKSGIHILEIKFSNEAAGGKNLIASTISVANILEKSTVVYEGFVVQNLLGAIWISLFPESGAQIQVRIPELDDYKILNAKYESGVLMIVGSKKINNSINQYDKLIFRFDEIAYDLRIIKNVTLFGINFVVLDNGICVHLNEEENIEIFSKKKGSLAINVIDDSEISGDMRLFKTGAKVLGAKGDTLYSLTMKKK